MSVSMLDRYHSSILPGSVYHWRKEPREHSFSYPIAFFCFDVDKLDRLDLPQPLLSHNRWGIYSIHDSDYLGADNAIDNHDSLRRRVERFLQDSEVTTDCAQILLLTMPRLFGYVFNPVSFFVCLDEEQRVTAVVTQVNNTFGETHVYPLIGKAAKLPCNWRFKKEFFVSPFFDRDGEYVVTLAALGRILKIHVDLFIEDECVFKSVLQGKADKITKGNLVKIFFTHGFSQLLTMTRIHVQALLLYFKVGSCPFEKPRPEHFNTIRSQQSFIHTIRLRFLDYLRIKRNRRGVDGHGGR